MLDSTTIVPGAITAPVVVDRSDVRAASTTYLRAGYTVTKDDLLHLLLEVSGQKKKEKDAKVQTARTMWVPAVNNLGTFGRWAFLEIDGSNLHKTKQEIRNLLTMRLDWAGPREPGRHAPRPPRLRGRARERSRGPRRSLPDNRLAEFLERQRPVPCPRFFWSGWRGMC